MRLLASATVLFFLSTVAKAETFALSSADFQDNERLQQRFAGNASSNPNCTGENISPTLQWKNPPSNTKSFALTMVDPTGKNGLGVDHLVIYNIPVERTGFAQGELTTDIDYTSGVTTPATKGYFGPCPPYGTGEHHYIFTVIATDLQVDALPAGLTHRELLTKLEEHALAASSLVGRFGND
ncbi:phosphatidylethanolamine-binding protein [Pseudomonas sp. PA15(2017)]|uniref:YbhB/YbcL family Raf kinase inhibitor-like protein n=1 Tax=Pseudomonas sp. PA15(2017) TaxID=1932111 RepID=UPI000965D8F5|nr:YbhB/YbcL family Raf kinase inhibitor-like protein [Pseudomonas sp. PA15(2017)]OLU27314.1 phosphatidylethanolamine-binding protein [Pseudomonas sp. PA15(2017)]